MQQCCTYIPCKSGLVNQYIHNISEVSIKSKELLKEGAKKAIGRGVSSIGKWFGSLGGGIMKTILIPLLAVMGFGILVLICVKVIKRAAAKKAKESEERKDSEKGEKKDSG